MTRRVTRVLHTTLDSSFRGGAETYLRALMGESVHHGVESTVFDLRLPTPHGSFDLKQVRSLLERVREFEPHIIHCHLYWGELVGAMIAPFLTCPLISTKYSLAPTPTQQPSSKSPSSNTQSVLNAFGLMPTELRLSHYADLVTTASEAVRDSYMMLGVDASKLTVIRTAHLTRRQILEGASRRHQYPFDDHSGVSLLAAARLEPEKGISDLLRAVAICRSDGRVAIRDCTVLGDGSCKDDLIQLSVELGVKDIVRFVGSQSQEECFAAMTRSDLVVVPSRSEGLSLVAQEAMAVGCPVVGTDCGGLHEVTGERSALVAPGDAAALAAAIEIVVGRPRRERWFDPHAHMRILSTFNVERSVVQTLAAYETACDVIALGSSRGA